MTSYWRVPRAWDGEPCYILAGGPSLQSFDAQSIRHARVIAINESYRLAPWAEILYFCDRKWYERKREDIRRLWTGRWMATLENQIDGVKAMKNTGEDGFDEQCWCLRHGHNSGYQAIHLAAHLGASPVYLLGYDMRVPGNRTHWHGGHGASPDQYGRNLSDMLPHFAGLAVELEKRGIQVVNLTPGSALECFPTQSVLCE